MKHINTTFFVILLFSMNMLKAGDKPEKLVQGLRFTEGPAIDGKENLFFSDVPEKKIYRYSLSTGELMEYLDNTGGANGLFFDRQGNLIACAGKARKVIKIDPEKDITVLADEYNDKKLNSPNDLWIDKKGGIYFTDPRYGNKDNLEQDGMHVYYIHPKTGELTRVEDNLTRPNGIIGSHDGKKLYVVDEGERKTYEFDISENGELKNKNVFCEEGIDGMTLTIKGNICITTTNGISVYNPDRELIHEYDFEVQTTNVVFHENYLYVTTQSGELYRVKILL